MSEYPGGIYIESSPLESTGGKVWDASLRFYNFICSESVLARGISLKILELGSGCGWLGLRIAKDFPAVSVTMSEQGNFGALDWLTHNMKLNPLVKNVRSMELDWANIPPDVMKGDWDLIIGCELVYSYGGAKSFISMLKQLLANRAIFCYYAHTLNRFESVDEMLLDLFREHELKYEVVYGSDALESQPGSFQDLFPELRLVIFKITN